MFKRQLLMVGVFYMLLTPPAFAQAIEQIPQVKEDKSGSEVAKIPRLTEIDRPATNIKDWLSQSSTPNAQSPVEVKGVRVNSTNIGIEVILETKEGERLKPISRNQGNTLITDISNSQLALPNAKEYPTDCPFAYFDLSFQIIDDRIGVLGFLKIAIA